MRRIETGDFFNAVRIIKNNKLQKLIIDKRKDLKDLSNKDGEFGLELFMELASNGKTEKALYEFLSPIFEIKDIKKLPPNETIKLIEQLAEENDLKDFFTRVERLMSKIKS